MTLTGLYVPLITPFDDDGTVARSALEDLAHQVLSAGATGLVALGTTAEPGSLNPDEQRRVLDVVGQVCADRRAPLVVGANSTAALADLRGRPGVVAALSVVPPFVRPGEDGVVAYFDQLAAASPVPVLVYHVPHRTAQELSPGAVHRLAGLPQVIGMKYAPSVIGPDALALFADPPDGFTILGGDDPLLGSLLALGAHGAIAASAHVATAEFVELVAGTRIGRLGHRLSRLATALFAEPNPTVIKAVLHAHGRIPTPSVRLPLLAARSETVDAALRQLERSEAGLVSAEPAAR